MTTAKKAPKKSAPKNLTVNMEVMGSGNAEADALEALLAGLGVPPEVEVIETISGSGIGEAELEAAVGDLDGLVEDMSENELLDGVPDDFDATKASEEALPTAAEKKAAAAEKKAADKLVRDAEKAAAKTKREADAAAKKAEKATAAAAPKEPKAPPVPRKHYASKVERVSDKLGAELGDYTVLTLSDAKLTGDELAAAQAETLAVMKEAGVKVQNRMTLLLEYVAGKSGRLNEVITRALTVLKVDGSITTGDKGNLHVNLLAKPYSPAAARAMGNNTIAAMRNFKLITLTEKGTYIANPESLILAKVNSMIGL